MFIIYSNYWNTTHLFTEWSTITQYLAFIMFLNVDWISSYSKKLMKVKCFDFVRFEVIWASKEILRLDWAVWIPTWWSIAMTKVCVGTSTCIGIVWLNINIITAAESRTIINMRIYSIFAIVSVSLGRSFEGWDAVFIHQGEDERIGTGSVAWQT